MNHIMVIQSKEWEYIYNDESVPRLWLQMRTTSTIIVAIFRIYPFSVTTPSLSKTHVSKHGQLYQ